MKLTDLAWLAGLLEGEGSFMQGPPSERNRIRISLQMTDEDVVARAAALIGISYRKSEDRRNPQWKPVFSFQVRGRLAAKVMKALRPLMGQRRQAQIDKALLNYVERPPGHPRKLSPGKVKEIRSSEASQKVLASRYGVSREAVSLVKRGLTWKHVGI